MQTKNNQLPFPISDIGAYHDTWKLLQSYRDVVWNLELAVQKVQREFEVEYGKNIDSFLDSIYLAGADIADTKLEDYSQSIAKSNQMLNLLISAVDILRKKHKNGEEYYWILYYSYLSPQEMRNIEDIVEHLQPHVTAISRRSYFRKREYAIEALSSILWGYSSKSCMEILKSFVPEEEKK